MGELQHTADASALDATMVLVVGYRGAEFSGFAAQDDQRTVAGELERTLVTLLRRPVDITCAGRTDAGVHALAQHVSLPVTADELSSLGRARLMRALNAIAPDDISVRDVLVAPAGFSARFDALSRSYRYRVCCSESRPVLSWYHAWWHASPLDVDAMRAASAPLVGEHDFKSFCKASSAEGKPTSRNIISLDVHEICEAGENLIAFDVRGNAFLHSMVRTLVGTLVEVGRGRRDVKWVKEVLEARDRRAAGQCTPAKGLTFESVEYPQGMLAPWPEGVSNA